MSNQVRFISSSKKKSVEAAYFQILPIGGSGNIDLLNRVYLFWDKVWKKTFESEDVCAKKVFSDGFLFNKEIGVLTCEEKIIGLIFFNQFYKKNIAYLRHSYFENYPKDFVRFIEKIDLSNNIMIINNLTICPSWRKAFTDYSVAELLIGLAVKKFQSSHCSLMISFTRNSRKINEIVYKYGALPFKKNHANELDKNVDVVYFKKQNLKFDIQIEIKKNIEKKWRDCEQNNGNIFKRDAELFERNTRLFLE